MDVGRKNRGRMRIWMWAEWGVGRIRIGVKSENGCGQMGRHAGTFSIGTPGRYWVASRVWGFLYNSCGDKQRVNPLTL